MNGWGRLVKGSRGDIIYYIERDERRDIGEEILKRINI